MGLPTIPFNSGIPFAPNDPSADQPLMLQNNISDAAMWVTDHIAFNVSGSGYHQQVRMPQETIPPVIKNFGGLYVNAALAIVKSASNLFFTNDGFGDEYQLTRTNHTNYATFGTYTNYPGSPTVNQFGGWTFLPGGTLPTVPAFGTITSGTGALFLLYGTALSVGSSTPVTWPFLLPNGVFSITTTLQSGSNTYGAISIGASGFTFSSTGLAAGVRFYWQAIGN